MGEPAGHESWTHGCWLAESSGVCWAPRRWDTSLGRDAGWQSPVGSAGPRGGRVEQGGLAVAPPGTGNRPGYWTPDVPLVLSEVRERGISENN